MRIKLKYPDVDTFIQKYAVNISRGGIFIATKTPKPVGTLLRFEFLLANAEGTAVIRGEGQVQWTREYDATAPTKPHGMGVKFTKLDGESQAIVERALAYREAQGKRKGEESAPVAVMAAGGEPAPIGATAERPAPPPPVADDTTRVMTPEANADATTPVLMPEARRGRDGAVETRRIETRADQTPLPTAAPVARVAERETRPVAIDAGATPERLLDVEDSVRMTLARHRSSRGAGAARRALTDEELDALARDWGVSPERLRRATRGRKVRIVEATAELERLLRRPRVQATRDEALRQLPILLRR
jgi:uncharacterized protein (TIGR02266 family)